MDAKMQEQSSQSLPAAAISQVLDDENLLGEILIHVIFPTSLVRAALVCRRWLRVASEPAFLRLFFSLHTPRLLGFYVEHAHLSLPKFVPMPGTPPELAAAVRRASSALDDARASGIPANSILRCRNGRLLVRLDSPGPGYIHAVLSPLHPSRDAVILPASPSTANFIDGTTWLNSYLPNGGVDARAAWWFRDDENRWIMEMHELRDGAWHKLTSPPIVMIPRPVYHPIHILDVAGRVILVSFASIITALRSTSSVPSYMSTVALPDVLEYNGPGTRNYKVSRVDPSTPMFHMVHVQGLQIHIWLHNLDSGKWSLEDTICLRKICADSGLTTSISQDGLATASVVKIHSLGLGVKSVFIQVDDDVLYIHIKSRVVEKVYSLVPGDRRFIKLAPFMMICSIFPESKEELSDRMD